MLLNSDLKSSAPIQPKILYFNGTSQESPYLLKIEEHYSVRLIATTDVDAVIETAYDANVDLIFLEFDHSSDAIVQILNYCHEVPELRDIPILVIMDSQADAEKLRQRFTAVDIFLKPLEPQELFPRIDLYLQLIHKRYDLVHSRHMLSTQLQHIQAILNTQEEMLAVFSDRNIILANSRFLNFFKVDTLENFILTYDCFAKTFVEDENSFVFRRCDESAVWINALEALPPQERNVVINNKNGEQHRFRLQIQRYELDGIYHVITLFDMTDLYSLSKKYEQFAYNDLLTGVANRRKFEERLEVEMSRSNRFSSSLSLMLFDLDHFKQINDTYGHEKGDAILRDFAQTIEQRVRKEDLFARWGGEEFILLLPQIELHNLFKVANELLERIHTVKIAPGVHLTCSIGISNYEQNMGKHEFIKLADDALYRAKESGRDRFEIL